MTLYPRNLRTRERELLEFVLPVERPGYRSLRCALEGMVVIGEGRRGPGNLILGAAGDTPDPAAVLQPVVAYGVVETTNDAITVTVREEAGGQIDVEIVKGGGAEVPDHFEEKRRWCLSDWSPGDASPGGGWPVRIVPVDGTVTLALATFDRRLWVHEAAGGRVVPVPVTGFHEALMRFKGIRDPAVALDARRLFDAEGEYTDEELRAAFRLYNTRHPKVDVAPPSPARPARGFGGVIRRWFGGRP